MSFESSEHGLSPKKSWRSRIEVGRFLWNGFRHLAHHLEGSRSTPPREVLDEYEKYKKEIVAIFGEKRLNTGRFFHGTGAIQYGGEKYRDGKMEGLRYPLASILKSGLHPHEDPWLIRPRHVHTLSLATSWSYAKWYADKHQSLDAPLSWEFGDSSEWFAYFIADTLRAESGAFVRDPQKMMALAKAVPSKLMKIIQTTSKNNESSQLDRLQKWVGDVRGDITPDTSPLEILRSKTDIPGNFGAVIILDSSDINLFPMGPGQVHEVRTGGVIAPNQFLAIAVPITKLGDVKRMVADSKLTLQVLPIEAIEYHLSQLPISDLTEGVRYTNK